jgi:hypothetical protein
MEERNASDMGRLVVTSPMLSLGCSTCSEDRFVLHQQQGIQAPHGEAVFMQSPLKNPHGFVIPAPEPAQVT